MSIPVLLHAPSQYLDVGHTLAQTPPSMLFSLIVSTAPFRFLKRSERINFAGSVPTGQAFEHGASWHNKHLADSSTAKNGGNAFSLNSFSIFSFLPKITPPIKILFIDYVYIVTIYSEICPTYTVTVF